MAIPKAAQLVGLAVCAAVAFSNLGVMGAAIAQARPNWVMFAFEFVILIGCLLGIRIARGRDAEGPALGLLCVAGTILVGSAFGYIAGGRMLFSTDLRMLVAARAFAALLVVAVAAWTVLSRDPRATMPPFIRGAILAVPIPLILGVAWYFRARLGGLPDVAQMGLAIGAFVLLTALAAASVQLLVSAFTLGTRRADQATPAA